MIICGDPYFRCLNNAILISVISPAPDIFFISRSFLPMAKEVAWNDSGFRDAGITLTDDLRLDFINKGSPP